MVTVQTERDNHMNECHMGHKSSTVALIQAVSFHQSAGLVTVKHLPVKAGG